MSKEEIEHLPENQREKKLFEDTFNIKINDKEPKTNSQISAPTEAPKVLKESVTNVKDPVQESNAKKFVPLGTVEMATIAITEDVVPQLRYLPVGDDALPDLLVRPSVDLDKFSLPSTSPTNCRMVRRLLSPSQFTSTWLSVSAKNINFADFLPPPEDPSGAFLLMEPVCEVTPVSMRSLDHLIGVKRRKDIHYLAEVGLKEAFQSLAQKEENVKETVERMATRIAQGLKKDPKSWILSTGAALYWRIRGRAEKALDCIRHTLYHAPLDMRDTPLIALANVMHRSGEKLNNMYIFFSHESDSKSTNIR